MLYLKEMVKYGQKTTTLTVTDRLPHFVLAPCVLDVKYHIVAKEDYYLAHLHVSAALHLQCQRCLDEFNCSYDNHTVIAICRDDARAEELLEHYECIVSETLQISIEDLVIDELYLYAPQSHPEISHCSSQINDFLAEKNESY